MKVLIINGSPRIKGNTKACALILEKAFNNENIEVDIFDLANYEFKSCTACTACYKMKNNSCILDDDMSLLISKVKEADGIILGSPIHFGDITGLAKNALDRLFYISGANGNYFRHKVGAGYVCVRRSGGIEGFHTLNNYLLYSQMFIATSSYWNIIHGMRPNEVELDEEGIDTLNILVSNMSYLMKSLANSTIEKPPFLNKRHTNFIR